MKISKSQQQQQLNHQQPSSTMISSIMSYSSMMNYYPSSSSISSSNKTKNSSLISRTTTTNRTTQMAMAFLLLLICAQIVTSAPAYDLEKLRDLYEIWLRQDSPTPFVHQMERKGGRSPTLRLRFGRRSDPLWNDKMPSIKNNRDNINSIEDTDLERMPWKE
uniref:Uncharacterized protein LOC113793690 n=1 Tax=Dermatophagoides pteronyssinus TaxID=6956 RepID=A0A6P6Y232_DERPT|nr:uncharacterized protein LOC113793690 [Dermatophagoides pteronyssinus]